MEIIKKGISPNEKPKNRTCKSCKTKFTYMQSDVKEDRDSIYIVCPHGPCRKFITIGYSFEKY